MEKAQLLRAQAEKARLEAERMDAELTLQKIARLERELKHEKAKQKKKRDDDDDEDDDSSSTSQAVLDLQREMEVLQARMRGETPRPTSPKPKQSTAVKDGSGGSSGSSATDAESVVSSTASSATTAWGEPKYASTSTPIPGEMSQKELEQFVEKWEVIPELMKKTMAVGVGLLKPSSDEDEEPAPESGVATRIEDVNATEVGLRTDQMARLDFSFFNMEKPTFTKSQIETVKKNLDGSWFGTSGLDPRLKDTLMQNDTEAALGKISIQRDGITQDAFLELCSLALHVPFLSSS